MPPSGGLHGVGVSVVNALSSDTVVEVARDRQLYRQRFAQGLTLGPLETAGRYARTGAARRSRSPPTPRFSGRSCTSSRRGCIGWRARRRICSPGVEIRWKCAPELIADDTPAEAVFQFPGGLADHLREQIGGARVRDADFFAGTQDFPGERRAGSNGRSPGRCGATAAISWYCNTIPTPDGGTHEQGLRQALVRGLRAVRRAGGHKRAKDLTADDVMVGSELMLSVFIREPQFQSQTKDRLTSPEAAGLVESAVRDHFDHFLGHNMERGKALLGYVLERMDERLRRKQEREVKRKTATSARKLRLPGKLTDCSADDPEGTELFIVEGDSAGGIGQAGARPQDPGDPADPRQDPQRRLGDQRQDRARIRRSPT